VVPRSAQPEGPYRIGGHSFGGLVAYEVGRKLRASGAEVDQVILLDTYLARDGQRRPPADEVAAIAELATMNRLMQGAANGAAVDAADIDPDLAGG
jgi:thioesterase domain-containing protein